MTTSVRPVSPSAIAPAPYRHPSDLRRDVRDAGLAALAFQAVLTLVGVLAERAFAPLQEFSTAPTAPPPFSVLSHTYRWDAVWIRGVMDGSYAVDPQTAAFYPLFPGLVELVRLTGVDLLVAGLVVNTVGTGVAVLALLRISRGLLPGPWAWVPVGLFLGATTAFYLHAFYSEAVFCALAFAAYAFARERRWAWMGCALALAGLSRVTAVLFLGLCLLEYLRAHGWRPGALLRPAVLWFPVSLLGFAGYALYLRAITGDPWAMFSGYGPGRHWAFNVFTPDIPETLATSVRTAWAALSGVQPFTQFVLVDRILPLLGLAVLLVTSGYLLAALRSDGIPLAAFGVASFLMVTLNGNLVAVHRYLLPCLSIYLALGLLASRRPGARPLVAAFALGNALLQGLLYVMFVSTLWAG